MCPSTPLVWVVGWTGETPFSMTFVPTGTATTNSQEMTDTVCFCRTELDKIVAASGACDIDCRYMALAVHPESLW